MNELQLQAEDVIRAAKLVLDAVKAGDVPCLADARLLRANAQWLESMVEREHVRSLRATTPAQDKASQVTMARAHSRRADKAGAA